MLRKTKKNEAELVMMLIEEGREFLKEQGVNQWQHGSSSRDVIINDIKDDISYIYEISGEIVATAMITTFDEDYESYPTFWSENSSYLAIHRLATAKQFRNQGIAREFMEAIHLFAKSQNKKFLRINTHLNNKIMRKFLCSFGFEEKGIIKSIMKNILDDKERVAYELEVK